MRLCTALVVGALMAQGCTHAQLQLSTLRQMATVSELRYQQVLDNLARIAENPGALPHFAVIQKGTTQVQDSVSPSGSLTWDPFGLTSEMLSLGASRALTDQWDVEPVHDPDRLLAMRCAYLRALGVTEADCGECAERLRAFKVDDDLAKIPPGWLQIGSKRDVPKGTCYVGRCGGIYVWVSPDGLKSLTRFTAVVMDIATVDKAALAAQAAGIAPPVTVPYLKPRREPLFLGGGIAVTPPVPNRPR